MNFAKRNWFLFLLFFLLGVAGVLGYRIWQVKKREQVPFIPQKVSFTLQPPVAALSGNISLVHGDVQKQGRTDTDFKPLDAKKQIIQGEVLATKNNASVTVTFSHFNILTLDPNAQIAFIDTLPTQFLLQQISGEITYQLLDTSKTISIRSLHVLCTITSGKVHITTDADNGQIIVQVISGNTKIAQVDTNNTTQIQTLHQGQTAVIDNEARTIKITNL